MQYAVLPHSIEITDYCDLSSPHGLRGSASPVLTAIGLVNGRWQFSTPYRIDPSTDRQKVCHRWLYRRPLQLCQIWCTSVRGGLLHEWVKYNHLFIYLFIYLLPLLELIYRSDASMNFRALWLRRRGLAQRCAFGGFVDIAPHLGGKIPPKPIIFGPRIGVFFKSNSQNRTTCILSKPLHQFQPNFAQW